MAAWQEAYAKVKSFIKEDIWQDPPGASRLELLGRKAIRVILLTSQGMPSRMIFLRASSLTYNTLLAIVPLLALIFSISKGLGFHGALEPLIVKYLVLNQQEMGHKIIEYINNTNFKALGALGLFMLLYTAVMTLGTIERSFNEIWGVSQDRPLDRKVADYLSVLIISPFLLILSLTLVATLSSNTVVAKLEQFQFFKESFELFYTFIPLMGVWIAFAAIYVFIPNTKVNLLAAIVAGVITGTVWEYCFRYYTSFNIGMARYNAIYSTFAALPFFLVWVYMNWVIILWGATIAFAFQNVNMYRQSLADFQLSPRDEENLVLHTMLAIALPFYRGEPPPTLPELAQKLVVPVRELQETVARLCNRGLVNKLAGSKETYQPALSLENITARDVILTVRNAGSAVWRPPQHQDTSNMEDLLAGFKNWEDNNLAKIDFRTLSQAAAEHASPPEKTGKKKNGNLTALLLLFSVSFIPLYFSSPASALEIGRPAPSFTLKDMVGKSEIKSQDFFRGHPFTVLIFWNTDCPDCVEAFIGCKELSAQTEKLKFDVLAVNFREAGTMKAQGIIKAEKIAFLNLKDTEGKAAARYGITGYSFSWFIIDQKGIIRAFSTDHPPDANYFILKAMERLQNENKAKEKHS